MLFSNKLRGDPDESHSRLSIFLDAVLVGALFGEAADDNIMAAVGESSRVTGLWFFFSIISSFDIEKVPLVQHADENSTLQGLRGCMASFKSLPNLLGDRSVENTSGFLPGLLRSSSNVGIFKGLSFNLA